MHDLSALGLAHNANEADLLHKWRGSLVGVGDAWRKAKIGLPTYTHAERVAGVYEALFNSAIDKKRSGGFLCYYNNEKRWYWVFKPDRIAREMNESHMFDFWVTGAMVAEAQARL